jgi:hypothetical protein
MRDATPTQTPHNSRSRDAALRRLRRVNRWLLAGSAALTAAFTAVAASAFPGRTVKAGAVTGTARSSTTTRGSGSSHGALKPPTEAPQATATQESVPTQQTAPTEQSSPAGTPTQESSAATEQESSAAAKQESSAAAAQETTPVQESSTKESAPVTSGGS